MKCGAVALNNIARGAEQRCEALGIRAHGLAEGCSVAEGRLQGGKIAVRGLIDPVERIDALADVRGEFLYICGRQTSGRAAAVKGIVERGEAERIEVVAERIDLAVDFVCARGCRLYRASLVPERKGIGNLLAVIAERGEFLNGKVLEAALWILRRRREFGIGGVVDTAGI